ncbi:MAG: restriction endonuclease [Paludibacteraceae bacterium]|nr:Mrr restriction system protein [Bacteroidales bacterium]MBO5013271.1 restriction endonuclease [Paludibacteraceae bacterium]
MAKQYSKSFLTAAKSMRAAMLILKDNGGSMPSRQLMDAVEKAVQFSDWEKEITSKGGIRWQNVYHFTSVDYVKAGYLLKKNGSWYITPEGETVLSKTAEEVQTIANEAYRKWRNENKPISHDEHQDEDVQGEEVKENILNLEELEEKALFGIREYIRKKNPYEFQDLVAALLRAMDYHTPFVAPKGKDGGVDVIAYVDPLGATTPRIKVQVKHYPDNPIGVKEIRSLVGILRDGDIGLFVTSGTFSPAAKQEAITSKEYVKLIDGDEFITMWQQYYNKMTDEDKNMLPLRRIAFLGMNE